MKHPNPNISLTLYTLLMLLIPIGFWATGYTWTLAQSSQTPELNRALILLTETGGSQPYAIGFAIVFTLILAYFVRKQYRPLTVIAVCICAIVGTQAIKTGAKTLFQEPRPYVVQLAQQQHITPEGFYAMKKPQKRERIAQINPDCQVVEIEDFVDEGNLAGLFRLPFDFVIDAIDQVRVKAAMAAHFVRHKQPFVVSGGAGGQRNPALIATADLSQTTHDPLLSNLRYTLRKKHGFPREGKMRVPCVYSREQITPPQIAQACDAPRGSLKAEDRMNAPQGLSCAGYGASMLVTASFGLHCATAAIEHIVRRG